MLRFPKHCILYADKCVTPHTGNLISMFVRDLRVCHRVPVHPGESRIFSLKFSGPGKSWKMRLLLESAGNWGSVLESPGIKLWFKLANMRRAEFGLLLKWSDNEFRSVWCSMRNASRYCVFVYSALGQVCWLWLWMMPCRPTIGLVVQVQYRPSWKKCFGLPEKTCNFFWAREWEPCCQLETKVESLHVLHCAQR